MNTIYKYKLEQTNTQVVNIPTGGKILDVDQDQFGDVCLWVLVDTDREMFPRVIHIFGTGHPLPSDMTNLVYLRSVKMRGVRLVWHVFENNGA